MRKLKLKHTYVLNDGNDGWETGTGKARYNSVSQKHFKLTVPITNLLIVGNRVAFRTGGSNENGTFFARSQTGFVVERCFATGGHGDPIPSPRIRHHEWGDGAMGPGRGHLGRGRGTVGHEWADLGLGTQSVGIANEML